MSNETPENPDVKIYGVLEVDLPIVRKRLEKLNKHAARLGCEPVELVIHSQKFVVEQSNGRVKHVDVDKLTDDDMLRPKYKLFEISLKGAAPKIAGWTFIGTLDHYSLPGKVIVNTVPGQEIPQHYHNSEGVCDHCGYIRNRKETFICVHENGETKQIGRQCLKDFLGHSPAGVMRFMSELDKLSEDMEGGFGGGWRGEQYNDLKDVLVVTSAVIRIYGWVPRSKADVDMGKVATSVHVFDYFNPPRGGDRDTIREWREFVTAVRAVEGAKEEAEAAIAWVKEQDDKNEYMHNIKTIAESEQINAKLMGYACSIVATYLRAMEALVQKAKKSNAWIPGEVKDKVELKVTVTSARTIDGLYGSVRLFRMLDEEGRTVVWFCSGESTLKLGGDYTIRGTIKKFDEYEGWKQTLIKRVKVLEVICEPRK